MLQVKIWFQNRRMKWRNSKERELLASGGSRDQTLPNKNNPNPDLSDARTDLAPSLSPPSSPLVTTTNNNNSTNNNNTNPQNVEQFNSSMTQTTHIKSIDTKFPSDTNLANKFDARKSPTEHFNNKELFKYEVDDNNRQGQIFNNLYDKLKDTNSSISYNNSGIGRSNPSANNNGNSNNNSMNLYYDDYDSQSDTDEEISVT